MYALQAAEHRRSQISGNWSFRGREIVVSLAPVRALVPGGPEPIRLLKH